jgi:hypothetical protein
MMRAKDWFWGIILLLLGGCAGMSTKETGVKEIIRAAGDSGFSLKSIKLTEDGKVEQIDFHDTVRHVR